MCRHERVASVVMRQTHPLQWLAVLMLVSGSMTAAVAREWGVAGFALLVGVGVLFVTLWQTRRSRRRN
jgi:hypothetical protein